MKNNFEKECSSSSGSNSDTPRDLDVDITEEQLRTLLTISCLGADRELWGNPLMTLRPHPTKKSDIWAPDTSGSTMVAALVLPTLLAVANVGDSRAVLARWRKLGEDVGLLREETGSEPVSVAGAVDDKSPENRSRCTATQAGFPSEDTKPNKASMTTEQPADIQNMKSTPSEGYNNFAVDAASHRKRGSGSATGLSEWILEAIPMSIDHKPNLPVEFARLRTAGCVIKMDGDGQQEITVCPDALDDTHLRIYPSATR